MMDRHAEQIVLHRRSYNVPVRLQIGQDSVSSPAGPGFFSTGPSRPIGAG